MTAGRPTDCTPELLTMARGYLTAHADMGDPVPTVAGLCCVLGIVRSTAYRWATEADKGEFKDILDELGQRQERALVKGGLMGDYNAPITKMMLTKHGYSDAIDTRVTSPDGSMSPKAGVDLSKAPPELLEWIVAQADAAKTE